MATKVAERAVAIAIAEASTGVFETNNDNRGPRIDEYQMAANKKLGQKWCAKFVYWCFEQAAVELKVPNPFPKIFGSADLEDWAAKNDLLVAEPVLGDVFVKERRHVGLVTGPSAGGVVPSVEGNTWAKSDFAHRREGVYVLKNEKVTKCTFIRLP